MKKDLNVRAVEAAMETLGWNQTRLAAELDVTRAAVSKWLRGVDFPRPDKLLRLGLALKLEFKELVLEAPDRLDPVVAFRRKGGRKTSDEHLQRAKHMGVLLKELVPRLPLSVSRPATLREPRNEYAYLQQVAQEIRAQIGVAPDAPIHFRDLLSRFGALHAVIVPVLWGGKFHHENALHIYLPDSMTTWVYLNLDSNIHDFLFWMAHELGHVYAPDLQGDEGEDFADAFAQTLLFPEESAETAYARLKRVTNPGTCVNRTKETAVEYGISPTTVSLAVKAFAEAHGLRRVDADRAIHAASTNFNKQFATVSESLFPSAPPTAKEYIAKSGEVFQTPFFDALRAHLREGGASTGYVQSVLQLPLLDAEEIVRELR